MPGLTQTSTIDLPENPVYWVAAYGVTSSFNDGSGGETVVTYALIESGDNPRSEAYRALTAGEIANIENSIAAVTQYSNITFVEGTVNNADILIGASSDPGGAAYGRTWLYTTQPVQVTAYDYVYSGASGLANNGYIYVHELLHGVGLHHSAVPFNPNGLIGDAENDGTTIFGSWQVGWDGEIQIFDIAVMQYLYGPDTSLRAGNDTYSPVLAAYDPTGDDSDSPLLWDGGGFDTLDFSGRSVDINVSLAPGEISQVGTTNTGILEAGTFSINYNTEIEQLLAGSGNDTLGASDFGSIIKAGAGQDTVTGGAGDDDLFGGVNADLIRGGIGNDTLHGDSGSDTISGNAGDDDMFGGTGHDKMYGGAGTDTLRGGNNNDSMHGGADDDVLAGNQGRDAIYGDDGDDILFGGTDNDMLWGGSGQDTMNGGTGRDTVRGGDDNDLLRGGDENDLLAGNDGADTLAGNAGDDRLFGGGGNDRLIGGLGQDTMVGGQGADTFVFSSQAQSHWSARDTIVDFEHNVDTIDLRGVAPNLTFVTTFSGTAGEIVYDATAGRLWIDITGSGNANFGINLTGTPTLDAGDLLL